MIIKNFIIIASSILLVSLCGCAKQAPGGMSKKGSENGNRPQARKVVLANAGKANFAIVVSPTASEKTLSNAKILAEYLKRITGAEFAIKKGDGSHGIALGVQSDFKKLPKLGDFAPSDPSRAEEYLIHSHPKGVLLVGATDLAAQNAMWDLLFRIGYRQYFPGKTWEIIPSIKKLAFAADDLEKPDYIMRRVWFGYGTYKENKEKYDEWRRKNRLASSFNIHAGHSYGGFIAHHKKAFAEHPEYFPVVDGKRKGPKLNIANPELRKLFVDAKLKSLKTHPNAISVSVDPSDGGGWDESPERLTIGSGSPSDQAVFLANQVADAVKLEFPEREIFVGMYAYYKHSAPPTIRVRDNVRILVATAFRTTPLSLRKQMRGWSKMGASLGVRDYLSYAAANYDVPSRCGSAFNFKGIAGKFKNLHKWGAVLYSGESSDNWGINGLLYFAAGRLLWDVDDLKNTENLLNKFITDCFGPVSDDIGKYYHALSPAASPVLEPQLLRKLYDFIKAARSKNPGEAINARLDDLILYTRYLELYRKYISQRDAGKRVAAAKA
ncbi:MAG: DUF4838 domain-containing protein, partial [Victivallales bacterium]|nr:DUF4838 domain-containing protein [Victivallales bacterium]